MAYWTRRMRVARSAVMRHSLTASHSRFVRRDHAWKVRAESDESTWQDRRVSSRLMLLDTASLYFRAFFGVPDTVHAQDGTPVNAVRGLLDFIARLVSTHQPTDLVCCWDDDWRPQWRVELIPSYKAHRVAAPIPGGVDVEETPDPLDAQVPMIVAALEALGIARVGAPGY